jgi:hypothetical protein
MVPFSTPPLAALKRARAALPAAISCASHPLSPLAIGFRQSTVHDDSDVAAGLLPTPEPPQVP